MNNNLFFKKILIMAEKNFIKWGCKEIPTQYGSIINLNLNVEQLKTLPVDNYGNIKLTLMKRREVGQYGDTHYAVENTFVPSNEGWAPAGDSAPAPAKKEEEEDMPF